MFVVMVGAQVSVRLVPKTSENPYGVMHSKAIELVIDCFSPKPAVSGVVDATLLPISTVDIATAEIRTTSKRPSRGFSAVMLSCSCTARAKQLYRVSL